MGSRAAKRWPTLHTCHPTHSAFQWSTAANVQTQPSSTVSTRTPSVPHMTWGAAVMMVPAWSTGSLTINGFNFGTEAPTVTLALSALTVLTPTSATSVQATLPTLLPGTYLLVLERTDDQRMAVFYLTLGAVGSAGPPGPSVYQ